MEKELYDIINTHNLEELIELEELVEPLEDAEEVREAIKEQINHILTNK